MTDILDQAQKLEELQRKVALKNRFQAVHRPSLTHCQDCDEPIPEKRRRMINGCTRCVDCQAIYELKRQNFRK